jgi:hypothetical protein
MEGEERIIIQSKNPRMPRTLFTRPASPAAAAAVVDGEGEEERACACYAMGFGCRRSNPATPLWQMPPILVCTRSSAQDTHMTIEILLIARTPMTESAWRTHAEAWIDNVQMHELITTPVHGSACVERFMEKHAKSCDAADATKKESLLDAYRLLSDGRMHPDDTRDWCMSLRAMRALRAEMVTLGDHMRQLVQERTEIARMIEYSESVLETTQILASMPLPVMISLPPGGGDHQYYFYISSSSSAPDNNNNNNMWSQQRQWLVDQQQVELRALESRELELLHAIELDRSQLQRLTSVRDRQEPLRAQRRREAATKHPRKRPAAAAAVAASPQ